MGQAKRAGADLSFQVCASLAVCMLMTWDSRNGRRLEKAVGLGKDYGLTALSRRVYLGNINKNAGSG